MALFDNDKAAALHRERYSHLPFDPALRVKTLESLAVERGIVTPQRIAAWVEEGNPQDTGTSDLWERYLVHP